MSANNIVDAFRYSTDNYPFNTIPQPRTPAPSGSLPILKCPADTSLQAIIINNSDLMVVKGWQGKSKLELNDLFIPVNSFFETEVLLPQLGDSTDYNWEMYHGYEDEFVTIDYGMLKDQEGKVKFICIYPLYINTTEDDQLKWKLKMRFQGETEWRSLGRIFMYSTGSDDGILPIELQNNMGVDVYLKIMVAN